MTDEEITKIALKLSKAVVTKEDLNDLATKEDIKKLETKIDEVDSKADIILSLVDGIDEVTGDHEKRLKRIEALPVITHE